MMMRYDPNDDAGNPFRIPRARDDDYGFVGCPDIDDRDAFAARVHGDSMSPKFHEGDIVIFSPSAQVNDGDPCFIRFANNDTTFKRVFFETDDAGEKVLRLQPCNERYRARVVPAGEVVGMYRAVFKYQRVD